MAAAGTEIVLMTSSGAEGDTSEYRHVPGTGGFHTLCGWCDCGGSETRTISAEGPPNCPACLDVIRKAVAYKKYV